MEETVRQCELPKTAVLAFLGDAVHALCVRRMLVQAGYETSGAINEAARQYVTAAAQAVQARRILPHLTETEQDLFRRARNAGHLNCPRHQNIVDYRNATGLEAVYGLLSYWGQEERIRELFALSIRAEEPGEKAGEGKDDTED